MSDLPEGCFARITLRRKVNRAGGAVETLMLREFLGVALTNVSLYDLMRMEGGEIIKILPKITEPPLTDPEAMMLSGPDLYEIGQEISAFLLL